jgi:FAD binding domain
MTGKAVKVWDEYDVVVLGAGAGGMTAACVAAAEGLRAVLIEKSPFVGGTMAVSGGMVWIPANSKMTQVGVADTTEQARLYLQHIVRGSFNEELRRAFLTSGDKAIGYLEDKTLVRLRPVRVYPDYYPDLPGATTGGRVLEPVPFDGRALGEHFRLLRWPLPEFMLLGGMMIDRADIPHFRSAGRSSRSAARIVRLLARYGWERLFAQRGASLYLGNALAGRLLHSLLTLKVDLLLNATVSRLIHDGASVRGVAMIDGGGRKEILAKGGSCLRPGDSRTILRCAPNICQIALVRSPQLVRAIPVMGLNSRVWLAVESGIKIPTMHSGPRCRTSFAAMARKVYSRTP